MDPKRIDLGGSVRPSGAKSNTKGHSGKAGSSTADKKKNLILGSIAGVALLAAGYLLYGQVFGEPKVPTEAQAQVNEAFDEAKAKPAPVEPPPGQAPEPGSGKKSFTSGG